MRNVLVSICVILFLSSCTKYSDEQFFAAIKSGDAKTVQAIINQRDMTIVRNGQGYIFDKTNLKMYTAPKVSASNENTFDNGFSGLWIAIEEHKPEIVKILLQQKFDLKEEHKIDDDLSITMLDLVGAGKHCNPSTIKLFAKNGADFDTAYSKGRNPVILLAASAGNWHCVYALIEAGADTNVTLFSGGGLLAEAVLQSNIVDISYLIQKMKNFDPLSKDAGYALLFAAQKGDSKLVKNFLSRGFNPCFNHNGKYIRDYALSNNHIETAELLATKEQCAKNLNSKKIPIKSSE